jgi:hypothetical protein
VKTELQIESDSIIVTSLDGSFQATIAVETGEVTLVHTDTTIDKLLAFVKAARSRYRKFMQSQDADVFLD